MTVMRKIALVAAFSALLSLAVSVFRPDVCVARAGAAPATRPAATKPAAAKPAPSKPAAAKGTLRQARQLYWKGRYSDAIKAYKALMDRPAKALDASIGQARACEMIGQYAEGLKALDATARRAARSAEWHLMRSSFLAKTGKYDKALQAARTAVKIRGDWAPAIFRLGEALETLGKKKDAIKAYDALEKAIARKDFSTDARSLVAAGQVLDRYAILTKRKASEQAENILHNYLQKAYMDVDKTYWPANVAAGIFLLTKHKTADAGTEFGLAAKLNAHVPDVHVGQGVIVLQRWQFEKAIAEADKALKINPKHADALLLKASVMMMWRKFDQVGPLADRILKFNPNHLEALSLMAALHVRSHAPDKAKPFIERVEKVNPKYAELHEAIGHWLAAERQFTDAEKHYRKAMELGPELAGPVASLGRLYMQTGQEDLARKTLARASAMDDYREDVRNYVDLLAKMTKFLVRETDHFIIKVDGTYDEGLVDWLAEYAEQMHKDIVKDFEHTPAQKTLVELFPDHRQFSVRITGRGWIGTVGACTGRVIAMPAPDPTRNRFGTFNWAVVLRHEYTHTVTLSATGNRIPHWFTEACAVWEQPDRRNFQAVRILVDALRTGKLYPVKELSWGFIRPDRRRGRTARSLAYAQSEWIFEYVVEKHGYDAIIGMLKGFRDAWPQEKVFKTVLKTTEADFDKGFQAWARQQVRSWGYDPSATPNLAKATAAAKAKPKSADAQAALALAYSRARRHPQAEAAAREALKIDADHVRALEVLAGTLTARKKYDEAIQVAKHLAGVDRKSATAPRVLAACYLARRKFLQAIPHLEAYKQARPLDDYAYKKLADMYTKLAQNDKALPNLIELHRRTMKDATYARRVADIYRTSPTPQKALHFYEEVVKINPYDAGAYKSMASLYVRGKDHDRAIRAMRSACLIDPKNADAWARLAMVYFRVGQATKSPDRLSEARAAAKKSIELDPQGPGADVLQIIEQAGKG